MGWREACCRPGAFGRSQAGIKGSGSSHRRNARALKAQYSCSPLGRSVLVWTAEACRATYRVQWTIEIHTHKNSNKNVGIPDSVLIFKTKLTMLYHTQVCFV